MFTFSEYILASSLEEAFELLHMNKKNEIIGGTAFLKMGNKSLNTAVDLSALNLNYIRLVQDTVEIGAMTTFRDIETSALLKRKFGGLVADSVKDIVGVQLRSVVTAGATVFSKYGFSDFIPALLALDTNVVLYENGEMSLEEFLASDIKRDILVKIIIRNNGRKGTFQTIRRTKSDYAVLNVAVSHLDHDFKVVVGARPGRAVLAKKAMEILSQNHLTEENIKLAAETASEEITFADNMRASGKYRKAVCKVMIERAIKEIM